MAPEGKVARLRRAAQDASHTVGNLTHRSRLRARPARTKKNGLPIDVYRLNVGVSPDLGQSTRGCRVVIRPHEERSVGCKLLAYGPTARSGYDHAAVVCDHDRIKTPLTTTARQLIVQGNEGITTARMTAVGVRFHERTV
jgi:hypothetical protein